MAFKCSTGRGNLTMAKKTQWEREREEEGERVREGKEGGEGKGRKKETTWNETLL